MNELTLLQTMNDWLDQQDSPEHCPEHCFLITVIHTWGSSPRPPGSMMIIHPDGSIAGSVSGGCIEQHLVKRLTKGPRKTVFPVIYNYGGNHQQAHQFGLPCGGQLKILVEAITSKAQLTPAIDAIKNNQPVSRHVCLTTGETSYNKNNSHPYFTDNISTNNKSTNNKSTGNSFISNASFIKKTFGPAWHLLIIGAGDLSQYVAQTALTLNYQVIICDPREEHIKNWKISGCDIETCMPDDFIKKYADIPNCIVLTLTHEPNLDDMALMEALDSNAFYVGALGSVATNNARRKRLKALDVSSRGISRLHGPVGLPIGSHTPAEIAISIFADIIATRNNKVLTLNEPASYPDKHLFNR